MNDTDKEETFIREIMSKSKLTVPFSDFDEKMMFLITRIHSRKVSFTRELTLAWIFFLLGSIFGIIVSIVLPTMQEPVMGISLYKIAPFFQIVVAILLVTQLDHFISFYKRHSLMNNETTD